MSAVFWQVVLLLSGQMLLNSVVQGCSSGWFGRSCNFPCMCNASNTCGLNGECPPNDRCLIGFFGPGCQYVDLVVDKSTASRSYLTDNNDQTCNPDKQATSVYYRIDQLWPMSWFRIYTSSHPNLFSFTVVVNEYAPYKDERHFVVNNHEVDVMWDNQYEIRSVRIKGDIAPVICSIYVTSGRNVALKQFANQTNQQLNINGGASNGVDGSTNDKIGAGSCVHTRSEGFPVWKLFFPRPQIILLMFLYNSERREPLKGFNLRNIDSKGTTVFNYTDRLPYAHPNYFVLVKPVRPTIRTELRPGLGSSGEFKPLVFCEIKIYGDNQCPPGMYGLECEKTCHCGTKRRCNQVTGACTSRCPAGKYGEYCNSDCSSYCLRHICHEDTGACLQCNEGYKGEKCDVHIQCPPGKYGLECEKTCHCGIKKRCNQVSGACTTRCPAGKYGEYCNSDCSSYCLRHICDEDTGACLQCHEGYKGEKCDVQCSPGTYGSKCAYTCSTTCQGNCESVGGRCSECVRGFYGSTCTDQCPKGCEKQTCHRDTGQCESCLHGHVGQYCTPCPAGTYGAMCYLTCSEHCINRTCDIETGHCAGCTPDFTGPSCTIRRENNAKQVQDDNFIMWMVVMVITFLVVIPLILIFCLKRDSTEQAEVKAEGRGGKQPPASGFKDKITALKSDRV